MDHVRARHTFPGVHPAFFRVWGLKCVMALLLLVAVPSPVRTQTQSQTDSQVKQEIDIPLQTMTIEELDRKLQDLGLTREEALRRARELGINVEDYITRASSSLVPTESYNPEMESQLARLARLKADSLSRLAGLRPEYLRAKKIIELSGFKGRRGIDSTIRPYGYDIFQYTGTVFGPVVNIATPASYLLGPDDELIISVWGETKLNYRVTVNREGNAVVPEVGPVSAGGATIQLFRDRLLRRMSAIYSGLKNGGTGANTFIDVSLGRIRTIQVFVLGEVERPGGYSLSSMSTVFHALYLAGGPTGVGSMREIQISREDKQLPPIDLYDYILRGDRTKDVHLQDGDVVFVKPAGKRVALVGKIVRPAIYEMRAKESLGDLVAFGGGVLFDTYAQRAHVERIIPFDERSEHEKSIMDLDVYFKSLKDIQHNPFPLEDGDIVTFFKIDSLYENRVTITGSVNKPGMFQLQPGMRMRDLLMAADSLQRSTFAERGTMFRMRPDLRREIVSFSPREALAGNGESNILLQNEDSVVVYKEFQFFPPHLAGIGGAVRKPGSYTRDDGMTVTDLVVLAGGLRENATTTGWQISRLDTSMLGVYSKVFRIDMPREYWNRDLSNPFYLKDFDYVFIPADPKFSEQKIVQVSGYAMFPGPYAIRSEGERLDDIMKRAGGIKPGAYLDGSVLVRKFNNAGLIPIDFRKALDDPESRDNVVVYDGDSVYVAFHEDVIYVRGEVVVPSAALYKQGAGLSYYIKQAGGYREEADQPKTVVFLPGGKKWEPGWFIIPDPDILPGSTIFVPHKVEKEDKTLPVLRDMATILASLAAITIAIVQVTK